MKAIIPSRYEPDRLRALVRSILPELEAVLILDNGHDQLPRFRSPKVIVEDARGLGLYPMWNRGRAWASGSKVAVLNDDVRLARGTLRAMAEALDDPAVGIAYPGEGRVTDSLGPYRMTGYCFAFRADAPVPDFDEGFEWWCGDTAFERAVLQAGLAVVGVPGNVRHESDSERDDWSRRPELKEAAARDVVRWAGMLAA